MSDRQSYYTTFRARMFCLSIWRSIHSFICQMAFWGSHPTKPGDLWKELFNTAFSKRMGQPQRQPRAVGNNDQYPRYAFNSATNTLIINCMPAAVHESVQFCFTSALWGGLYVVLEALSRFMLRHYRVNDCNGSVLRSSLFKSCDITY